MVALSVDPISWDPERGLTLATEISVNIRFVPATGDERARTAPRQAQPRRDRLWEGVYRGALLNGAQAAPWARRVPPAFTGGRNDRAEAALKLRLDDNGIYGLTGDSLIAAGIPAGTPLAEIALYRQQLNWVGGQPEFDQTPRARFFIDFAENGQLDAGDTMVFVGRRLRYAEASPDSVEWFGRGSALWVARAPELALAMPTESGWQEGSYSSPTQFRRHARVYGETKYYWAPPSDLYVDRFNDADPNTPPDSETWVQNLYYFVDPRPPYDMDYIMELDLPSPGYVAGTDAELELYWQGQGNNNGNPRDFYITVSNDGGSHPLSDFTVMRNNHPTYVENLASDVLADGVNNLAIDRINESSWTAMIQYWDLTYDSHFRATNDSLLFHARDLTGPQEFRIGGFTRGRENWLLLRSSGDSPTMITLGSDNQAGGGGDFELRFRADVDGGEHWWAIDQSRLLSPGIEAAAPLASLDDAGPYDVLAIVHDDFLSGMQRWVEFREAQGYRVKVLAASEVWDLFYSGCRGPIGVRNATRYAYQQWGAGALLLVGDSSKDARGLDSKGEAMPDFLPIHSYHEIVGGVDELVGLEEWVAKFSWNDWPAMLVGRLPVGNEAELESILDKILCYENYGDGGDCDGDGDWRRRFMLTADDSYGYTEPGLCSLHNPTELGFQEVQEEIIREIIPLALVDDIEAVPFFISEITVPWYEEWEATHGSCPISTDVQQFLRPLLSPVFIDSLSQGYSMVTLQSHANRATLGHEEYFKVAYGPTDHEELTNGGRPFFWIVYGCHGNAFASHNEGGNTGDSVGEKLLFVDGLRGAVASYASEGFEYLFPNIDIGKLQMRVMLLPFDSEFGSSMRYPEWTLGAIQLVTELHYGVYNSSYRMNLLGDPLSRMDIASPRVDVFVNGDRLQDGEFLPPAVEGDTLTVEAIVKDETYISSVSIENWAAAGYEFEKSAAWLPHFPDGATLVDISIPADLEIVGSVNTLGNSWDLSRVADSVFVADGGAGMHVLAVSNPSNPKVIRSIDTPGYANAVVNAAGHAFVADGAAGLQVIDVLPLSEARIVASLAIEAGATDVAIVDQQYLLVAGGSDLTVIDITLPQSPMLSGSIGFDGTIVDIAVGDGFACLADSTGSLQIVSLGDFANPVPFATLSLPGQPTGLAIAADKLYVASGSGGLHIVDLGTPSSPELLGTWDSPGHAWDVAVLGDNAYLADELEGMHSIGIADPANPVLDDTLPLPGGSYARGIIVSAGYAILAQGVGPVDPLLARHGQPLGAYTSPVDTLMASESDLSRAWHLRARVPYDFGMEAIRVVGRDLARRSGSVTLPLAKIVEFYLGEDDSLRAGQWVRSEGEMQINILVPSTDIDIARFSLAVDGVHADITASAHPDDPLIYRMIYPYSWDSGQHELVVLLDAIEYGSIILNVDADVRLTGGRIFPNPFRTITTFGYSLTGAVNRAELSIYSLSGRLVYRRELTDLAEGEDHMAIWDGLDRSGDKVANGVYISRLVFTESSGEQLVWEDKVVRMR